MIRVFNHYLPSGLVLLVGLQLAGFVVFGVGTPASKGAAVMSGRVLLDVVLPSITLLTLLIAVGSYRVARSRDRVGAQVSRFVLAAILFGVSMALVHFILGTSPDVRTVASLSAGVAVAGVLQLLYSVANRAQKSDSRILILGTPSQARKFRETVEWGDSPLRAHWVAEVDTGTESFADSSSASDAEAVREYAAARLERALQRQAVDNIVLLSESQTGGVLRGRLTEIENGGVEVVSAAKFISRHRQRIPGELLEPALLIEFRHDGTFFRMTKRAVDLLASAVLMFVALPLMLGVVLAIKLQDGWTAPILYSQQRVGRGGRLFSIFKFRSMCVDAEKVGGAQWAQENDPRITPVGRIMRLSRIDELPQLFNILRGDMSLVGPRPERPEFVEQLEKSIPNYGLRHQIKPGVTGWAQISYPYGGSEEGTRQKLEYDLYYLMNRSVLLDMLIAVRTVEIVLFGRGAQ